MERFTRSPRLCVFVFRERISSLRIRLGGVGRPPWSLLCKTASIPFCPAAGSPLTVKVLADSATASLDRERTRVYPFSGSFDIYVVGI